MNIIPKNKKLRSSVDLAPKVPPERVALRRELGAKAELSTERGKLTTRMGSPRTMDLSRAEGTSTP